MSKYIKIILIILLVFVGIYMVGKIAVIVFVQQKFSFSKTPTVYVKTKIFNDYQNVDTSGADLIKLGNISFYLPSKNQFVKEQRPGGGVVVKKNNSTAIVIIPLEINNNSFISNVIEKTQIQKIVDSKYGSGTAASDFQVTKAIFTTLPADVSLFSSFRTDLVTYYALILKNVSIPTSKGVVYIIENNRYQALYIPDSKTGKGPLELYNKNGKNIATIVISNASQQEISYIINTLNIE